MHGFLARHYAGWRAATLRKILEIQGLMRLLMKRRNTGKPWSSEEKIKVVGHLKEISKTVPLLLLFCLPGGSLFLPLFSYLVDRRKERRLATETADHASATETIGRQR